MLRSHMTLLWLVATLILLQGCGLTKAQKHDVDVFGQAAATLGSASKEQYFAAREHVVEMKSIRLAIQKKSLPRTKPDGFPANREFYASRALDLDSGLDADNIDRRVAAVDLLQQYGNLLVAFSNDTQEKELENASDKFARSVEKFPHTSLSQDEIKGLGEAVRIAGRSVVEHDKKEALKRIVPRVSPFIVVICDLLERDLDPAANGVAGNVYQVQDRLASEVIDALKRPADTVPTIGDRLILIDGFRLAERQKEELESSSRRLLKAVADLRKANHQLFEVIEHDKTGLPEIREFGEDAAELAKAVRADAGTI